MSLPVRDPRALASELKFRTTRVVSTGVAGLSRFGARHLRRTLTPGRFTVIAVNWNTEEFLVDLIRGVRMFSPDADLLIVDNASSDDSRALLRREGVRTLALPINVGHGPALDLAVGLVRTEYFATLDVDAFPVRADWLDVLRRALDEGNVVVGGHMHRGFAHPSMLAMRTADFRDRKHTFIRSNWQAGEFVHGESWDVAERISMREPGRVALIEPSEVRGPGVIGTVYGGIVYHNWFSAQGPAERRSEARLAWTEAVQRFLDEPAS
ncbi:MAG: glycosyltransferase family 2 protein [Acidimicrobiia bacterium]